MSRPYYNPKQQYIGTGSVDTYTFDFKIESLTQLEVVVVDDTGVETERLRGDDTTYLSSVTFNSVSGGGTVVLLADLPASYKIVLLLANDEPTQPYPFSDKRSFTLKNFETALDFLVGPLVRGIYLAKRSMRLHDTDNEVTISTILPPGFADNPDAVLAVNDTGDGFKFGVTTASIANNANAAAASALAAAASETAAAASALAAAASETNAAASETAAAGSETNAGQSETNAVAAKTAAEIAQAAAEAAQAAAENAANSSVWANVVFLTTANSPRAISDADKGTLFVVDTTGGNFTFNLDAISTLTLTAPWSVGIKKSDASGNLININRGGGDTFDDASILKTISVPSAGMTLVPDNTPNPDVWSVVLFGAGGGSAAPDLSGTLGAPTPIAPLSGIAFSGTSYFNKKFLVSNGGAIVVGSSPQIAAGTLVGQKLSMEFCSDTDTIELNDGNGLDLAAKFISENKRKLELEWNGSVWSENWRR